MYAVVKTGGKQYRVEEGRMVKVDRLPGDAGDTIELGDVLLMGEGDTVTVGAPFVAGARVIGTIREQGRDPKVVVFRYKPKTRQRKKTGHRAHYTRIVVSDILAAGQQPKPKAEAAAPVVVEPAAAEIVAEKPKRARKRAEAAAPAVEAPAAAKAEAPAEKPKRTRKKTAE